MKLHTTTKSDETPKNAYLCAGIHELIDWEIIQYRKSVDTHRRDLSKVEGRCVAWQEAEKDFNGIDRASMGKKWRTEYCGLVCQHRNKCLTALHFTTEEEPETLSRAG